MSGTDQTAAALFRAGKLDDAIAAAQAALRKAPTDLGARVLLGEMLLFAGNLERADVVLDAASAIDPSTAVVVAEFRQLVEDAERAHRREAVRPDGHRHAGRIEVPDPRHAPAHPGVAARTRHEYGAR